MRRIKQLFLASLLVLSPLFSGTTVKKVNATENLRVNQQITSFETLEEYYTFQFGNRFGKVSLNSNKEYITDGEASMEMQVWGYLHKLGAEGPSVSLTLSEKGDVDLSRLKNFTFDLFNETGAESYVDVALNIGGVVSDYQTIKLSTGKNAVKVAFDIVGLGVGYDLTEGRALILRFPVAPSYEDAQRQVYYIDNLQMNMTLVAPTPFKIELDANEFCSFDKAYQKYVTKSGGIGPTVGCEPLLSLNTDIEYCANNTGKSLRVELPTGIPPMNDGWPTWTFIYDMLEAVDWGQMAKAGKKLVFDVYNTGSYFRMGFEVQSKPGSKAPYWSTAIELFNGWNTISIDLASWNAGQTDEEGVAPNPLTENVSTFFFSYSKFAGDSKVFYFDNFRFE